MSHPKKRAFLAAYAQLGTVTHAAQAAGIDRRAHARWMKDPEYAAAFTTAREEAADRLEREAIRRAVDGVEKPVYQGGKLVGTIREYSDTLLIFTLKGLRFEKYRERYDQRVTADVTRHESNSELDAEIRQLVDQLRGQGS